MLITLSQQLVAFWEKAPALEAALYLFLGTSAFYVSPLCFFLLCLLLLGLKVASCKARGHALLYGILLITMGSCYSLFFKPPLLNEAAGSGITGNAIVKILEKRPTTFFGKRSIRYKLLVEAFTSHETEIIDKPLECICYLKPSQEISASYLYLMRNVKLLPKESFYHLKIGSDAFCVPLNKRLSLVEWRYKQKLKLSEHLSKYIQDPHLLKFFGALTLGYLDSKPLSYAFSKAGLQHLLTISGFHFALLALFCAYLLKPFLPKKQRAIFLILLLTLYVIYLGPAPSVDRAWVAITLYLLGDILERYPNGLNSLGIAACLAFIDNPLICLQIGFQLSYLATLGILAFYTPCKHLLHGLIPSRPLPIRLQLPLYEKFLYYFLVLIKKGLALDLAVTLFTLPVLFYHFGSFPLLSFFYNLWIPFLVGGTLFLLLLGVLLAPIPQLCGPIHHLNVLYTEKILSCVIYMPPRFDIAISLPQISCDYVVALLCLGFFGLLTPQLFKQSADVAHRA